jgi:predicted Zn finger-like uncharacterized protein
MFTVCPKCTLTLSVSAGDLRTGQGYVRCGRCQNVFNALLTLSEQPPEATAPAPATSQGETAAATATAQSAARPTAPPAAPQTKAAGEASSIQIDQILMLGGNSFPRAPGASADSPAAARGSAPASASVRAPAQNPAASRVAAATAPASARPAAPASTSAPTTAGKRPTSQDVQIESEDITDQVELPRSSRDAAQRTAAPRASTASKPSAPAAASVRSGAAASQHKQTAASERAGETKQLEDRDGANMESRSVETIVLEGEGFTQIQGYVSEEQAGLEALRREIESLGDEGTASASTVPGQATVSRGRYHEPSSGRGEAERGPRRGAAQLSGAASHEAIAAEEDVQENADEAESVSDFPFNPFARADTPYRWAWVSGALALGLLLGAQGIDHWREALAASPGIGSWITRAYAHVGVALEPHWDLGAYEVRQQGAASDPSDGQVIHVRLSLANHASRAQPVPLLRLTLLDRYGKHIARRDLTPTEYWPQGRPGATFLTADQRVDTEVAVRDPNAESASFELDVCLRAQQRIQCAGDTAGATASALTR